jgi:hypothetical protein
MRINTQLEELAALIFVTQDSDLFTGNPVVCRSGEFIIADLVTYFTMLWCPNFTYVIKRKV